MKLLIVLVIAFLATVYIFTFIKIRKRRKNQTDAIDDYRKKYIEKESLKARKNIIEERQKSVRKKDVIDYIEKEELYANKNKNSH